MNEGRGSMGGNEWTHSQGTLDLDFRGLGWLTGEAVERSKITLRFLAWATGQMNLGMRKEVGEGGDHNFNLIRKKPSWSDESSVSHLESDMRKPCNVDFFFLCDWCLWRHLSKVPCMEHGSLNSDWTIQHGTELFWGINETRKEEASLSFGRVSRFPKRQHCKMN